MAGDVVGDVISREIEGTSGTMNHGVSSTDPLYNGLLAPGVDVTVARGTQGQVIIEESGGLTDIRESGDVRPRHRLLHGPPRAARRAPAARST